jgi:hypothetical protein
MRVTPVRLLLPMGIVLVVSSACSHSSSAPDPYRADVLRAYKHATSAFERSVLVDGKITRAEYDQATMLYVRCVKAHGIPIAAELEPPLSTCSRGIPTDRIRSWTAAGAVRMR